MAQNMQLVTQIQFSDSGLTKVMFTIMEYSIYGQNSVKRMRPD